MRSWPQDHPKALLMAKKRGAIVAAAREAFLASGYRGVSMEAIATSAGVSIMTLYRHSKTKDDLFQAVVSEACEPPLDSDEHQEIEAILNESLCAILTFVGTRFLRRLEAPESLGLLRAVMVERRQFPHLSELAYDGFIGRHVRQMEDFLAGRIECSHRSRKAIAALSSDFFDLLMGHELISALLGTFEPKEGNRERRARRAANALVAGAGAGS